MNSKVEPAPILIAPRGNNKVDAILYNGMLVNRSVFYGLGGFDENYLASFFDVDFCLRAAEDGIETIVFTGAELSHAEAWRFREKRSSSLQDYKRFSRRFGGITPTNKDKKKKLLVVKLLTFGDCLCAIPALKAIRAKHPLHEITFATNERYVGIFKGHTFYDKLILIPDIDKKKYFYPDGPFNYYDQVTNSAINSNDYDKVIELNVQDYPAEYKRSGRNFVQFYADVAGVTISPEDERPEIKWDKEDEKIVDDLFGSNIGLDGPHTYIAMQCKAGWELKNWGLDNYKKLLEDLPNRVNNPRIFLLDPDVELDGTINAGKLTFNQIACLMKKYCHVFIGPDSGFHHLASAVDCPTVCILGCANPIIAWSYSKYSVGLVPPTTCETPCLTVKCYKYGDSDVRGCTQDVPVEMVTEFTQVLVEAKKEDKPSMKMLVLANGNKGIPIRPDFVGWEWKLSQL